MMRRSFQIFDGSIAVIEREPERLGVGEEERFAKFLFGYPLAKDIELFHE
jgi:hypothetical protein